jgi:thiamine monophosphate kinase
VPKLRSGQNLKLEVEFVVTVNADTSEGLIANLHQILSDLGISDKVSIEER